MGGKPRQIRTFAEFEERYFQETAEKRRREEAMRQGKLGKYLAQRTLERLRRELERK